METANFRVYVAASAAPASLARVTAAIAALKSHGFTVTCTWPQVIAAVGVANPRDAAHDDRRGWSVQDLAEIDEADAVWFLVPTAPDVTRGAWFESGYAFAEGRHLVFSGDTKQSVFCALGVEFETDTAALTHLRELAGLYHPDPIDAMAAKLDEDRARTEAIKREAAEQGKQERESFDLSDGGTE